MGPLKPISYHRDQGNSAITSFNENLAKYCQENKIAVFDSFNMTTGVNSFDGTHFGIGVNMMKVQILLNYLEEKYSPQ